MQRKILESQKEHQIAVLENGAEVYGIEKGYINESKYHSNFAYDSITLIGEFSVDYDKEDLLLEDRKVANIIKDDKKTLNYQIYVHGKEGPVPHFHVVEDNNNNGHDKLDCCICIFEPLYFDHGYHTDKLNSKELKILDSFLRSYSSSGVVTYWQEIVVAWDQSNRDNVKRYPHLRKTSVQPDYTHISGYKTQIY